MNNKNDIVMVSAVRTPFSRFDSPMNEFPSIDLGKMVMKEVIERVNVAPGDIDEINYGSCVLGELALEQDIPDRQALLLAGFPPESISMTIDRACCASLTAIRLGCRAIKADEAKICLAAGADNMPRAAHFAPGLRGGNRLGHIVLKDYLFELGYTAKGFAPVAVDAGEVAVEYGVTREIQDEWALNSQLRYAAALEAGKFKSGEEILPVSVPRRKLPDLVIEQDECPRKTSLDALSKLKTVYGSPTVTAGNAPPMCAGASAILFMTRQCAEDRGLNPLATIVTAVPAATEPRGLAVIPALTIQKALKEQNMSIDDMDLIEINEAFAAIPLVSTKILADGDDKKWENIKEKTNVNGGALAVGHPIGASGCRILMTMAYELNRRGGGYGVAAICGGLAQAEAVIIKV